MTCYLYISFKSYEGFIYFFQQYAELFRKVECTEAFVLTHLPSSRILSKSSFGQLTNNYFTTYAVSSFITDSTFRTENEGVLQLCTFFL